VQRSEHDLGRNFEFCVILGSIHVKKKLKSLNLITEDAFLPREAMSVDNKFTCSPQMTVASFTVQTFLESSYQKPVDHVFTKDANVLELLPDQSYRYKLLLRNMLTGLHETRTHRRKAVTPAVTILFQLYHYHYNHDRTVILEP
jgi:hypothetical protein